MKVITIDFETYYSKDYSLSKMTTEEYIRDDRFEVIGVAVKVNNGETHWASGDRLEMLSFLMEFDWENSMMLGQNTMFDGAIMKWIFDIEAKAYADTMCMSRALDGVHVSASLKAQAERHVKGRKGTEVHNFIGMRRCNFSEPELSAYGDYCVQDVELTYELFKKYMATGFPVSELKVIDLTLRMFIDPMLELDPLRLRSHLQDVVDRKEKLLVEAGVSRDDLMSNNKFAELLRAEGIDPPTKVSAKTGKTAFAFAKTDQGFKDLLEHENANVQALAEARLGNKSTLEETRTERFLDISKRGSLPVPIKYYGAHTGRFSGQDKINLQNLPSRGPDGKKLKNTIMAPDGYMLVEADLSQIEARLVAWLAGQQDLVEAFAKGEDVYKLMASKIYGVPPEQVTAHQRFIGKMTILGAGYGMGAERFREQIKAQANVDVPLSESRMIIQTYRSTNFRVKKLWADANKSLEFLCRGQALPFGREGVINIDPEKSAVILPNGLPMYYTGLHVMEQTDKGAQYGIKTRNGTEKIYGGKSVENVCQALAKLVIAEQMLLISKKYRVVLTVHDSVIACVPEDEVYEAGYYVYECLRHVPDWATGLPLDCEVGYHKYYGSCGGNAEEITKEYAERWRNE